MPILTPFVLSRLLCMLLRLRWKPSRLLYVPLLLRRLPSRLSRPLQVLLPLLWLSSRLLGVLLDGGALLLGWRVVTPFRGLVLLLVLVLATGWGWMDESRAQQDEEHK